MGLILFLCEYCECCNENKRVFEATALKSPKDTEIINVEEKGSD